MLPIITVMVTMVLLIQQKIQRVPYLVLEVDSSRKERDYSVERREQKMMMKKDHIVDSIAKLHRKRIWEVLNRRFRALQRRILQRIFTLQREEEDRVMNRHFLMIHRQHRRNRRKRNRVKHIE